MLPSILLSYNRIFVICLKIRTLELSARKKSHHFVLVKIYKADITFPVIIEFIICAHFT